MISVDNDIADLGHVVYGLRLEGTSEFRYIGMTTKSLGLRCRQHNIMTTNNFTYAVYKWLRKYSSSKVEMVLLSACKPDVRVVSQFETFWIKHYRSSGHRLLNSTDGGEGLFNPSEETRRKQSEAAKLRVGPRNNRYGKVYTPEERLRKSLQQKGKINVGVHTRWHVNRDLVLENCSYCMA